MQLRLKPGPVLLEVGLAEQEAEEVEEAEEEAEVEILAAEEPRPD